MDIGKSGWLLQLVAEAAREDLAPPLSPSSEAATPLVLARARVIQGLVPRDPDLEADDSPGIKVLRQFVQLAQEVAGPLRIKRLKESHLLSLFATLAGRWEDAGRALEKNLSSASQKRLAGRVEDALVERAPSFAGDPAYGLALHNGIAHLDAQVFGRNALELFQAGKLLPRSLEWRSQLAARQKALLVEVLVALACVERLPEAPTRRIILRQLDGLLLPDPVAQPLKAAVKKRLERPRPLEELVRPSLSRSVRHFLLEQALLASLVDGRRSPQELVFLHKLSSLLGFEQQELAQVEVKMAGYYARNRSAVDVFTVSAAAVGEEMVASMQEGLEKNFYALLQELRETGELSLLLAKAARGQKLTAAEKKAMREQLFDLAKAIPALAIFAAPGGLLLLMALAKVLPFNLLPSAFHDKEE